MGKVIVYDFEGRKLGECKDEQEASRVYEIALSKVQNSIKDGTCYSGLIFKRRRYGDEV